MKSTVKKPVQVQPVQPVKQTSGDKAFDEAIDRLLAPRPQSTK